MAIPLRRGDPAGITASVRTFFVTSSIAGKRNLLQSHRSAQLFIEVLHHYHSQNRFLLHDFVVMPDHFHALITVGAEMSIERAVQFIKGGFAFRAGKGLGFRPPVWERGFSEVRVNDSEATDRIREYILMNPVRRRLVLCASDYPYSSANLPFTLDELPQGLKPGFSKQAGTPEDVP